MILNYVFYAFSNSFVIFTSYFQDFESPITNIGKSKKWNSKTHFKSTFLLSEITRVLIELPFLRFHVVILIFICIFSRDFDHKYHQYRKKWTSKTGVKSTFYLIERGLWSDLRLPFFTILFGNLTKKYHQYRKKWTSKTGVKSTFYLIERELWPNFVFYDFAW